MRKLIFLITLITYFTSYAQVYKGTLGKFPIYLKIEQSSDTNIAAYYFYESQLKNIQLTGEFTKEGYKLYEKYASPEEKKELFSLTIHRNQLKGTWLNGQTLLLVNLSEVNLNLAQYKKDKLKLEKTKIQKINNLEIVWFKEKHAKIAVFRLGKGFTKSQQQFLNIKLDSIQKEAALNHLECEEYQINFQIKQLTNKIISFTENYSVYCGGAYPSHGIAHYNFDLSKNKEIKNLQEIYPDFNFVAFLKEKYKNTDLNPECNYFETNNSNAWKYAQFYITEDKILIQPSYPHAMAPCREYFEISKAEIGQ